MQANNCRHGSWSISRHLLLCEACLILVLASGCEPSRIAQISPQTNSTHTRSPLVVWQAPLSTPEQRVDAVNRLIPPGSRLEEVIELLGNDGVLCHYPAPTVATNLYSSNGKAIEPFKDLWQLEYRMPGGTVAIRFDVTAEKTPVEYRFTRAVLQQTIEHGK